MVSSPWQPQSSLDRARCPWLGWCGPKRPSRSWRVHTFPHSGWCLLSPLCAAQHGVEWHAHLGPAPTLASHRRGRPHPQTQFTEHFCSGKHSEGLINRRQNVLFTGHILIQASIVHTQSQAWTVFLWYDHYTGTPVCWLLHTAVDAQLFHSLELFLDFPHQRQGNSPRGFQWERHSVWFKFYVICPVEVRGLGEPLTCTTED